MPARDEIPLDRALRETLGSLSEEALVQEICEVRATPMVPEIQAYLATDQHRFWRQGEEAMAAYPFGMPFWGIPWAGGLALARWVLDFPEVVRGKVIWCFAGGAGIEAIAALKAGAAKVIVNDIDPIACTAARLNAALNGHEIEICVEDVIGEPLLGVDLFFAGDFCYDESLSQRTFCWLDRITAQGIETYIGDPGRVFLARDHLMPVWRGSAEIGHDYDDADVRRASVFRYA